MACWGDVVRVDIINNLKKSLKEMLQKAIWLEDVIYKLIDWVERS